VGQHGQWCLQPPAGNTDKHTRMRAKLRISL
jgi:hypothetical protein